MWGSVSGDNLPNLYFPLASHAHYTEVTDHQLFEILKDPRQRINPIFHTPKGLKQDVLFWLKIYTKYSSYQTVIYDKDHPEIIYAVLDDRDLFENGKSAIMIEIVSKQRLKKTLASIHSAMQTLQKNSVSKFKVGTIGHQVTKAWGSRKNLNWALAESRIRTQLGQRDHVMRGIHNSERFSQPMEYIFEQYGLPKELTKIPLLESSFTIIAHSKASAVGVWQFLKNSGKEYLTIDDKLGIDERISPIKATVAAAKMFKRNMHLLQDYALAVIAYNHGPRNLLKLKYKYGVHNIDLLLDPKNTKSPLGYASRNYYAEFLAILLADNYRTEIYGMPTPKKKYDISIVKMTKSYSVFEVASDYNIPIDELRIFNPDIFNIKHKLPKGTRIVIPRSMDQVVYEPTQSKDTKSSAKLNLKHRGLSSTTANTH